MLLFPKSTTLLTLGLFLPKDKSLTTINTSIKYYNYLKHTIPTIIKKSLLKRKEKLTNLVILINRLSSSLQNKEILSKLKREGMMVV